MRRHRRGFGWLVLALAVVAIAVCTLIGMMTERSSSAEAAGLTLRPGEFQLLVRTVYHEARSDGLQGMVAVAHVALNRLEEPERFGKTLREILLSPHQFALGPPSDESDIAWLLAIHAASGAALGRIVDPTGSATHFHKADMKHPPRWTRTFTLVSRIGSHAFYRHTVD